MNKFLITFLTLSISASLLAAEGFSSLEEQMTGKEFTAAGLDKLSAEELAVLNAWVRAHSLATLDSPKAGATVATSAAVAETQKVDIACWPVRLVTPQHKQHRTLQDKAVPITGFAEAVQESFQSILGQEQLEILTPFTCQCQQPVTHRGRCVLPVFIIHVVSASR